MATGDVHLIFTLDVPGGGEIRYIPVATLPAVAGVTAPATSASSSAPDATGDASPPETTAIADPPDATGAIT